MTKILIAGGSGLIGQEIIRQLEGTEAIIHVLSRKKRSSTDRVKFFQWDLQKQFIEDSALEVDHIINLTGAGIADARWTDKRKEILVSSRVNSAKLIKQELTRLQLRPKSYISASAIGYYGDSGSRLVTEDDSPSDNGFLSTCCQKWEEAASTLAATADRVAIIRVGVVLSTEGGAFAKIVLPFKAGMASYFGDGSMIFSWIHALDIANVFVHALQDNGMDGIYNAVAPNPVSNKQLVSAIKDKKSSFAVLHSVPEFALKLALGEMSSTILSSSNVSAQKLVNTGFKFEYPNIDLALEELL